MDKLHYRGDWRKFQPNRLVGPDNFGAWYLPVSAHYFDGITTIFYKPVPADQLPAHCQAMSKRVVAKQLQGKEIQWPRGGAPSQSERLRSSSLQYQISRRSTGNRKTAARGGKGLTKSQRESLKRFRKRASR